MNALVMELNNLMSADTHTAPVVASVDTEQPTK